MRLPGDDKRLAIVGSTGSGKSVAALWHLSKRSFDTMPWIIYDFKTDAHINSIEGAQYIDLETIPEMPGIYILSPRPDEMEAVEAHLWKIWEKGSTGIWVDEGYMMDKSKAFEALLIQGRSKHIPMIVLTQRPAWISRFVFSEADFIQIFRLNDARDKKTVQSCISKDVGVRLPEYCSYYYDVGADTLERLSPVPDEGQILSSINARLLQMAKKASKELPPRKAL